VYAWGIEKDDRELRVLSNTGSYNGAFQMLKMGVGRLLASAMCRKNVVQPRQASPEADARGLVPAVFGLSPPLPDRRQPAPAFALLAEARRYRGARLA
jgi:hypothetical protein